MSSNNLNSPFTYFIIPLPYSHIFNPYQFGTLPKTQSQYEIQVKIEDTQTKRIIKIEDELPKYSLNQKHGSSKRIKPNQQSVEQSKKQFKKDRNCPVAECKRKYSSRIALRAHIRKQHEGWYQKTSDYQP